MVWKRGLYHHKFAWSSIWNERHNAWWGFSQTCQAFSIAGNQKGFADTRGTLFFEIERIIKYKQPQGFILENVEGLVKHDLENKNDEIGRTLKTILYKLEVELGYIFYEYI